MSLNLKNPRAHALAAKLAGMTGENLTTAVIRALEERLHRESEKRLGQKTTSARILSFAERFASGMPEQCRSEDHASMLYGDDGMPR